MAATGAPHWIEFVDAWPAVDWYNHRRLLEPIGNVPPAEAEERYYQQLIELPLAA